jgi:FtsP/CotA-like multicopper oxidase with cupredoxin domain
MEGTRKSRREFVKVSGLAAGGLLLAGRFPCEAAAMLQGESKSGAADYALHIKAAPIEIAPKHFVSTVTYNGQFPGPLLRFQEGKRVTIDIFNETDTPEQLHWHGQFVSTDVDGASEEGTPFVTAQGKRRITFTPKPSGLRFYHTPIAQSV